MGKRLLALVMSGLLLGAAVPAAAQAAPVPAAAAAAPSDSGLPFLVWYGCMPDGSCHTELTCAQGTNYNSGFAVNMLAAGALAVNNYCSVRVWLHQNTDWSGYSLCLSPGSGIVNIHRPYHNVYISSNHNRC